jgi:hypothetical protein
MLIAAMILGIVAGTAYFLDGMTGVLNPREWPIGLGGPPWWTISLIPIGLLALAGAFLVCWKPRLGLALLVPATVSILTIGLATYSRAMQEGGEFFYHMYIGGIQGILASPIFLLVVAVGIATFAELRKTSCAQRKEV